MLFRPIICLRLRECILTLCHTLSCHLLVNLLYHRLRKRMDLFLHSWLQPRKAILSISTSFSFSLLFQSHCECQFFILSGSLCDMSITVFMDLFMAVVLVNVLRRVLLVCVLCWFVLWPSRTGCISLLLLLCEKLPILSKFSHTTLISRVAFLTRFISCLIEITLLSRICLLPVHKLVICKLIWRHHDLLLVLAMWLQVNRCHLKSLLILRCLDRLQLALSLLHLLLGLHMCLSTLDKRPWINSFPIDITTAWASLAWLLLVASLPTLFLLLGVLGCSFDRIVELIWWNSGDILLQQDRS